MPTADKIAFVDRLSAAGLPVIEVSAFVSPKWVPQMADAAEVFAGITPAAGRPLHGAGAEPRRASTRADAAGVREIAIFAAASETFSRKNINQTIDESLDDLRGVSATRALGSGPARARVPVDGVRLPVRRRRRARAGRRRCGALLEMGVFEVAVSDTIGIAHPGQIAEVLDAVPTRVPLAGGAALPRHARHGAGQRAGRACIGVTTFDAPPAGLGGCPYAPGAAGNLATEDLIYMLDGLGIETGVSLPGVVAASRHLPRRSRHPLPSRYLQAEEGVRSRTMNRGAAGTCCAVVRGRL